MLYFLPRGKIENYNVLINGRNFYDRPINDEVRKYQQDKTIITQQGNF